MGRIQTGTEMKTLKGNITKRKSKPEPGAKKQALRPELYFQ